MLPVTILDTATQKCRFVKYWQLVIETTAKMGFKPNVLARSLARGQLRLAVIRFTSFSEFHELSSGEPGMQARN